MGQGRLVMWSIGVGPTGKTLLELLEQAYAGPSWHGPTLRAAVARVEPELAFWQPPRNRHSIAEQVLHAAYWKYGARRKLAATPRGAFPIAGSDWPALPGSPGAETWSRCREILDDQHTALHAAIAAFPEARWSEVVPGKGVSYLNLARGVALHDVYHAGQIKLLIRLAEGA
jgi:hypothetical protein